LTKEDLFKMDKWENGYHRYTVGEDVFNYEDEKIQHEVQVYHSPYCRENWEETLNVLPSLRYLNLLYEGSIERCLKKEYIEHLEKFVKSVK
jgi:hypothetical protein